MTLTYAASVAVDFNQTDLQQDDGRRLEWLDASSQGMISSRRLQSDSCGLGSIGDFQKGTGPDPPYTWDNGFPFDPNAKATVSDYLNWARFGILLQGARIKDLDDARRAYGHFRGNTGSDLSFDFEKAIADDIGIRSSIESHLKGVENAISQLHGGDSESSFDFHSTDSQIINLSLIHI